MARSNLLSANFSKQAAGREEALNNPLSLISRSLYLPRDDEPQLTLARWALPAVHAEHDLADEFQQLLKSRKAFIVGGTQFVVEMGLLPSWYRDDANRDDALRLIGERGVRPLLDALADRENGPNSIFGKADIPPYLKTLPPLANRPTESWAEQSRRQIRKTHALRLRKAIEFIFLTEAVVRWRFRLEESIGRFKKFTGAVPRNEDDALFVWDHLWIEPVLYVVYPEARTLDIPRILKNPRIVDEFKMSSGQDAGALFWALKGVPGKYKTIEAACAACNQFYGPGPAPARAVTVPPHELSTRIELLDAPTADKGHLQEIEYLPELGPPENII